MDHRVVAAVSLSGICLDVLGGLYLAYDLLGGRHGPLRLLTRMVTYSIVFGTGYALGLGLLFGIASGLATGITVALELHRVSDGRAHYPLWCESFFSAIRGLAFGAGLYPTVGFFFALTFALLITAGQIAAYTRGMRPSLDYSAVLRPRLTRRHIWGAVLRTLGYIIAALICGTLVRHIDHIWLFCATRRRSDGACDHRRHRRQALHRILRGQPARTAFGSLRNLAGARRFQPAIVSVLARHSRCRC